MRLLPAPRAVGVQTAVREVDACAFLKADEHVNTVILRS